MVNLLRRKFLNINSHFWLSSTYCYRSLILSLSGPSKIMHKVSSIASFTSVILKILYSHFGNVRFIQVVSIISVDSFFLSFHFSMGKHFGEKEKADQNEQMIDTFTNVGICVSNGDTDSGTSNSCNRGTLFVSSR